MVERKFIKGDRCATTRVPAAAVRMLAEGWQEVLPDVDVAEYGSGTVTGYVGSTGDSTGPRLHGDVSRRPDEPERPKRSRASKPKDAEPSTSVTTESE